MLVSVQFQRSLQFWMTCWKLELKSYQPSPLNKWIIKICEICWEEEGEITQPLANCTDCFFEKYYGVTISQVLFYSILKTFVGHSSLSCGWAPPARIQDSLGEVKVFLLLVNKIFPSLSAVISQDVITDHSVRGAHARIRNCPGLGERGPELPYD